MSQKTNAKRKEHRHTKAKTPNQSHAANNSETNQNVVKEPSEYNQIKNNIIPPAQSDEKSITPTPKRSRSFFNLWLVFFHLIILVAIGGLAFFVEQKTNRLDEKITQEMQTLASSIQSFNTGVDPKQITTLLAETQKIIETVQNNQSNLTEKLSTGNSEILTKLEQSNNQVSICSLGMVTDMIQIKNEIAKIKDGQAALSDLIKSDITPQFSKNLEDVNKQWLETINVLSAKVKGMEERISAFSDKMENEVANLPAKISDEFKETKANLENNLNSLNVDTNSKLNELNTMLAKTHTLQTNLETNTIQIQKELQNLKALVEIQSATK